ncbi:hypothetical protein U1Q18_040867 [Sarracenia purpurea var. burkii]
MKASPIFNPPACWRTIMILMTAMIVISLILITTFQGSTCTSNSTVYGHDDDGNCSSLDEGHKSDGGGKSLRMFMSRLSIESFHADADADEEFSDEIEGKQISGGLSSNSDKELLLECCSLPATPQRRRNRSQQLQQQLKGLQLKQYASENEAQTQRDRVKTRRRRRRRRRTSTREIKWVERSPNILADEEEEEDVAMVEVEVEGGVASGSGGGCDSDECEKGGKLVVVTKAKRRKRSLCMDLEEVKACRELGFELEHEIMPTCLSISASTLDTSSGGNSPISNWRISSPGDDPRDVRARLKVWARVVALASTSRHGC